MMKIFLTGATGFIGSHFINCAHQAGHKIVALRRSEESQPRVTLLSEPSWLTKALRDVDEDDMAECDVLVHLAAHSANVPYDTIENCMQYNLMDPLKLFHRAVNAGLKRFIVAGSCFEYGKSGERYVDIPVDAPLEPTSSYPASKAAASVAFHAFAYEQNVSLLILRIFQVYGEGELESRFWPSLRKAALAGEDMKMTTGDQVRDFMHVKEVAKIFVSNLEREDLTEGFPIIENIGTGNPKTLAEFAQSEWKKFGGGGKLILGALPQRKNEVMRFVPKIAKR
ncbi:MAG: NAD-dependent epimerase/dehydratase family protein [Akkermansiaceae bacterium]|nr:NAD-dependent epimerase/dehydratase family protein [Akkermansiaceae bacterium]